MKLNRSNKPVFLVVVFLWVILFAVYLLSTEVETLRKIELPALPKAMILCRQSTV